MKLTAAYCRLHRRALTWGAIKHCGCVDARKQHKRGREICKYLCANEEHPIWEQRRLKRLEKKRRKVMG
jgi:hypothetical protein